MKSDLKPGEYHVKKFYILLLDSHNQLNLKNKIVV